MKRASFCAGLLALAAACSDAPQSQLVGRWIPDHARSPGLQKLGAQARALAVAHEAKVGEQSVEFDDDGTLIHVAGPLTRRAQWRVTVRDPLTIETRTKLGDGTRTDVYRVVFESPSVLVTEEPDGYRAYYRRAG